MNKGTKIGLLLGGGAVVIFGAYKWLSSKASSSSSGEDGTTTKLKASEVTSSQWSTILNNIAAQVSGNCTSDLCARRRRQVVDLLKNGKSVTSWSNKNHADLSTAEADYLDDFMTKFATWWNANVTL